MTPAVATATAGPAPRRRRIPATAWVVPLYGFLALFILYPLSRLFIDAVRTEDGAFTLTYVANLATDPFYRRALGNSLLVSVGAVAVT